MGCLGLRVVLPLVGTDSMSPTNWRAAFDALAFAVQDIGIALVDARQQDGVDVDVGRAGGGPEDRVGYVVG